MIYSLRGTLTYEMQGFVVIECGGVGYKCSTSMTTMRALPKIGSEVTLLTYMSVREDAVELFGFATSQELECFKMLIGVSGVGSKVGIALLSEFLPEQIAVCIASSDAKTLTKASGVGNKLAQRIILELKDKIKKLGVTNSAAEVSKSGSSSVSFEKSSSSGFSVKMSSIDFMFPPIIRVKTGSPARVNRAASVPQLFFYQALFTHRLSLNSRAEMLCKHFRTVLRV